MSFDEIQFELGVAMQCGRCEGCARDVVAQCSATHPIAAIHNEAHACAPLQTVQLATQILESKALALHCPLSRLRQSDSCDGLHLVDSARVMQPRQRLLLDYLCFPATHYP